MKLVLYSRWFCTHRLSSLLEVAFALEALERIFSVRGLLYVIDDAGSERDILKYHESHEC